MNKRITPMLMALTLGVLAVFAFLRVSANELDHAPNQEVNAAAFTQPIERPLAGRIIPGGTVFVIQLVNEAEQVVARTQADSDGVFLFPVENLSPYETYSFQVFDLDGQSLSLQENVFWRKGESETIVELFLEEEIVQDSPEREEEINDPAAAAADPMVVGQVTAADTSQPVEGVQVRFYQNSTSYMIGTDTTDINGFYSATLPADSYTVRGYARLNTDFIDKVPVTTALSLTGLNNQTVLDFTVDRKPIISGTVTSAETGDPLPSVDIYYYLSADLTDILRSVKTDANGQYQISGFPEGSEATLLATLPQQALTDTAYIPTWAGDVIDQESVAVFTPQLNQILSQDIVMQVGGFITGVVSTSGPDDLSNAQVSVYNAAAPDQLIAGTTNYCSSCPSIGYKVAVPSGSYLVQGRSNNSQYAAEFYDEAISSGQADVISLTVGQIISDVNIVLDPGGTISGEVSYSFAYTPTYPSDVAFAYLFTEGRSDPIDSTAVDLNGEFSFEGLNEGPYFIAVDPKHFLANSYTNYDPETPGRDPIFVKKGMTTTIEMELNQVIVSGQVTDQDSGAPLESIYVTASLLNDCGLGTILESTNTAADGTYEFNNLRPAQYRIEFSDDAYPQKYQDTSQVVVLEEGQTIIDQSLTTGGELQGRVTAEGTGDPLPGVFVYVYVYSELDGRYYNLGSSTTDANGDYSMTGLMSDEYVIYFDTSRAGQPVKEYVSEFFDDELGVNGASLVDIGAGQSVTINEQLSPGGSISGRITSSEHGERILGSRVYAQPTDNRQLILPISAQTNISGEYKIDGLAPGDYRIWIEASNNPPGSNSPEDILFSMSYVNSYLGGGYDPATATIVTVSTGAAITGLDQSLDRGGVIYGRYTLHAENLFSYQGQVTVYDSLGRQIETVSTNSSWPANWNYAVGGLPPGSYFVRFQDWDSTRINNANGICVEKSTIYGEYYGESPTFDGAAPIVISGSEYVPGIDGIVTQDNSRTYDPPFQLFDVSGRITASGSGVASVLITADSGETAHTAADGTYTITVPNGSRTLTPLLAGKSFSPAAANINVTADQGGVDFTMSDTAPSGSISGQVSPAAEGLLVEAYRLTSGEWLAAGSAVTASDGTFDVTGLPAGSYRLRISDPAGQYQNAFGGGTTHFTNSSIFKISDGQALALADPIPIQPAEPQTVGISGIGSIVDRDTGDVTVRVANGSSESATFTFTPICSAGPPSSVFLSIGYDSFPMLSTGNGEFAVSLTLPDDLSTPEGGVMAVRFICDGISHHRGVGTLVLYDPSGVITDASTGQPLSGATVRLYRVPLAEPDSGSEINDCRTVDTRPAASSGPFGAWSDLPPANLAAGQLVNADVDVSGPAPIFDPAVNPQTTDTSGRYGWDVAGGCWFIVVEADGYLPLTSPLVGVPPEVTDLDIALEPELVIEEYELFLPSVVR
ncbi:MAG: carboxypeptidase regulatory-like domain-containing protein [Ardenticatenaceae bacterium]|nr:carboxypeptidase regulatory-like domain-containing protein [Ardenticatenaceae bacterium]